MTFPFSMWFSPVRCLCGEVIRHTRALLRSRHPSVNVIPPVEFKVSAADTQVIETRTRMSAEQLEQLRAMWSAKFSGDGPEQILPLRRDADGRLAGGPKPKAARPIYRSIGLGWWQHMGWLTPFGHRIPRDAARGGYFAISGAETQILEARRFRPFPPRLLARWQALEAAAQSSGNSGCGAPAQASPSDSQGTAA